jgi:hypothetical protein
MHAAQCPGAFSSSGGRARRTAASLRRVVAAGVEDAAARRVGRRRHVALEHDARRRPPGRATGMADSSACVYGMSGSA